MISSWNYQGQEGRLIPYVPDEIAMECLIRIPVKHHSSMKLVCRGWRSLFSQPCFHSERRRLGAAEHLIFLVQPEVDTDSPAEKKVGTGQLPALSPSPSLIYSVGVYNLTRDTWHRLTMSSGARIPMFCQSVSVPCAGKLVLIGGWDPETLEPVSDVYVIDVAAGTWRRGSPMRKERSFFACGAGGKKVWVAGGHDGQKNALRSAEVYDVEADEWAEAPEMAEERDECLGIIAAAAADNGLKFWVVSGYGTDTQGRFRSDAEVLDTVANRWVKVEDQVWPFTGTSPRSTSVVGGGGNDGRPQWWSFGANGIGNGNGGGEVKEFNWEEKRWTPVLDMPKEFQGYYSLSLCAVDFGQGWFVMGSGCRCGGSGSGGGEVLAVGIDGHRRGGWKQLGDPPPAFCGFPFSASHLLI